MEAISMGAVDTGIFYRNSRKFGSTLGGIVTVLFILAFSGFAFSVIFKIFRKDKINI
jgi:hypothetical protein